MSNSVIFLIQKVEFYMHVGIAKMAFLLKILWSLSAQAYKI